MSNSIKNTNLEDTTICQVGIIVRDIERSMEAFCRVFGLPRPEVIEMPGYERVKTTYRGGPSEATAKLAFFDMGQVQLELIEPDGKPSVWQEFLDEHGEGVHHLGFQVADTGRVVEFLAGEGIGVAQQGLYGDLSGQYTYMDSAAALGVVVELLESFGG